MRIRKHAARILPALSIPAQPRAAAAVEAPACRELEVHVCELNQSPWDAMTFSPPRVADLYDYQGLEDMEEDSAFAAGATLGGHGEEELAAAVTDVSGCPTLYSMFFYQISFLSYPTLPTVVFLVSSIDFWEKRQKGVKAIASLFLGSIAEAQSTWRRQAKIEEMAEEEDKRVRKIESKKKNSGQNTKKIKRKIASSCEMERAEEEKVKMELEPAAAVTTCKKSDGKGWHCKRAAQRPHSLCEYHLTQVRSYYSNGGGANHLLQQHHQQPPRTDAKLNAALIPDKKKNSKKKTTTAKKDDGGDVGGDGTAVRARKNPTSDFYYYYSGFGPWRGKRRSGGRGDDGGQEAGNVDASDGDDARDGVGALRDGAPSMMVHDQGPDDLDDDDEDMDGCDEVGGCDWGDAVAAGTGRRRGRKPIKARSLKSLL